MIFDDFQGLPVFLADGLKSAGVNFAVSKTIPANTDSMIIFVRSRRQPGIKVTKFQALEDALKTLSYDMLETIISKCRGKKIVTFSSNMHVPEGIDEGVVLESENGVPVRVLCAYEAAWDAFVYTATVSIHA